MCRLQSTANSSENIKVLVSGGKKEKMKTAITINEKWSDYEKTVARCQLINFRIIFLDKYGKPIDNEYELEELNEKYQKRTKYNIISGKEISNTRYYTLAELKEIYGAQTVNLNFPYMVLQNIHWDNPLILYIIDMKTLKFDTINGKTNTYQVKEA
jgi:hypothetical protein